MTDETVLHVMQNDSKLKGRITTNKRIISYCFDDSFTCCNDFGVEESQPLTNFIGKVMMRMDLSDDTGDDDAEHSDECHSEGSFTIFFVDSIYTLKLHNYHNGYYTMNFDVEVNGVQTMNIAL